MKQDRCKLWNPWAAGWSLLFSPAFGAWLHAANWHALGRPDKAAAARRWGWLVIVTILLAGVAAALFELYARGHRRADGGMGGLSRTRTLPLRAGHHR